MPFSFKKLSMMLVCIASFILIAFYVPNYAENQNIKVYFDGNSVKALSKAFLVDREVYLPARDFIDLVDGSVIWDANTRSLMLIYRNAFYKTGKLPQGKYEYILREGKAYLPYSTLTRFINCEGIWNDSKGELHIASPFVYLKGKWYRNSKSDSVTAESVDNEVSERLGSSEVDNASNPQVIETLNGLITWDRQEQDYGNEYYLYYLKKDGSSVILLKPFNAPISMITDGKILYVLTGTEQPTPKYSVTKIELNKINQYALVGGIDLGLENFHYGRYLSLSKDNQGNTVFKTLKREHSLKLTKEGLYIIGYRGDLAKNDRINKDQVDDLRLFKESYGYYLLPIYGGKHQFVKPAEFM